MTNDAHWMHRCLELAAHGAGHVSPNPLVGAVVVGAGGAVLGEGWHARYGGPHAEVHAIEQAEQAHGAAALRAATLYVNLEPCSHHGKTPPCADLILAKGIPRVVVGMQDPFPEVAGRGLARLRGAGVDVTAGVLEHACRRFNEAFIHHLRTGRPLVTLKTAQTLDGCVATASGHARWVSSPAARQRTHQWRAELDGILVGSGTALADDPALTVRHVEGRQPRRFVLDRAGVLPPTLRLFTDAHRHLTTAIVGAGAAPAYADAVHEAGGHILHAPVRGGHLDLGAVLGRLGQDGGRDGRPLQSLLVEAGPGLATALFREDLVDRYFCFVAPKLVGGGLPALRALGIGTMDEALRFAEHTWEAVEGDLLFRGYRRAA
ncbi:MAG: bifunctional diaminohydroxyphosphoribosylaminopyrimidine deaminase/5-amino-6-(5-phosphoribosylamino)uracil reductase RibD [Rhodothermales bacterium]|nr:bifunctional diaminohydroxyphosphoribosylaminopyrimidine deaminase/5-amino-6-(5-phosphoribosylamino)uracil reductase RibD [Rhodothermales bacterium]